MQPELTDTQAVEEFLSSAGAAEQLTLKQARKASFSSGLHMEATRRFKPSSRMTSSAGGASSLAGSLDAGSSGSRRAVASGCSGGGVPGPPGCEAAAISALLLVCYKAAVSATNFSLSVTYCVIFQCSGVSHRACAMLPSLRLEVVQLAPTMNAAVVWVA